MSITPNTSITDDGLVTVGTSGDIGSTSNKNWRGPVTRVLLHGYLKHTWTWKKRCNKSDKTIKSFKSKSEKEKLSYLDVETLERHISKFWNTKRN